MDEKKHAPNKEADATHNWRAKSMMEKAYEFFMSKEYEDARDGYNMVIKSFPGTIYEYRSLIMKGCCHAWLDEQEEKVQCYRTAVGKFPNEGPDAYWYLGLHYIQQKKYKEAIENFEIVLERYRKDLSPQWLKVSLSATALSYTKVRFGSRNWKEFRDQSRRAYEYYKEVLEKFPWSSEAKIAETYLTQTRRRYYESHKD